MTSKKVKSSDFVKLSGFELSKLEVKVRFNETFFSVRSIRGKREKGIRYNIGSERINALLARNLASKGIVTIL